MRTKANAQNAEQPIIRSSNTGEVIGLACQKFSGSFRDCFEVTVK